MEKTKIGIELIAEERREQIEKHGFSLEKDAKFYTKKELVQAANYCLMLAEFKHFKTQNYFWPNGWDRYFEHKIISKSAIEKLIVAGAFLMAENDRRRDHFWDGFINELAAEINRLNHEPLLER